MKKILFVIALLLSAAGFTANYVAAQSTATCGIPDGLTVTNLTANSATLNWNAVDGAIAYNVQYKPLSTLAWITLTASTNTLIVNGLLPATTYEYRVRSICSTTNTAGSVSPYSVSVQFTTLGIPPPPTCGIPDGLTATNLTANSATLNWNAVDGAIAYNVQYKPLSSLFWITLTASTNTLIVNGLLPATTYEYKVRTVCPSTTASGSVSPYSVSVQFTTLGVPPPPTCGIPDGLTATNLTANSATLSWNAVAGAIAYNVQYKPLSSFFWITLTASTNTLIVNGLLPATTYEYKVRTVCPSTTASGSVSPYSVSVQFTTLGVPPPPTCGIPDGLTATNLTANSATLSWNAVAGAIAYNVQYKPLSSFAWITLTASTNTLIVNGLLPATTYEYKVRTVCPSTTASGSVSPYSVSVQFTTLGVPPPPTCGIPDGLTATNLTANSATLSWNAVAGAIAYNVQYKPLSSLAWITLTASTNTLIVNGLLPATTYEYRVRTVCAGTSANTGGFSPYSLAVQFTTMPPTASDKTTIGTYAEVSLFPNPTNSLLYLQLPEAAQIQLNDMSGRVVYKESKPSGLQSIDVYNLKPGIYVLTLLTLGNRLSYKVWVQ